MPRGRGANFQNVEQTGGPLALFKKAQSEGSQQFKRDPRKASKFFEHAATVADSRNYDYAIECYVNGLRHDPGNIDRHEALRDVAQRRTATGGKGPSIKDKLMPSGGDAVDRMLHAETMWAKDPFNEAAMVQFMGKAVEANAAEELINLGEVAYWIGEQAMVRMTQTGKFKHVLKVRDYFAQIGAYDKAVEACRLAIQNQGPSPQLLKEMKDLEAERTMQQAGYEKSFRGSLKDADTQRDLEQQEAVVRSESAAEEQIRKRREAYEQDPESADKLKALVEALAATQADDEEDEAIRLLGEAFERTSNYALKVSMDNIRMRQMRRHEKLLKQAVDANARDKAALAQFEKHLQQRVNFEHEVFTERVKQYPTDMRYRFDLGQRQYQLAKFDEAIESFQQAQRDPKVRPQAMRMLGQCYMHRNYIDAAVDTFRKALDANDDRDPRLTIALLYHLMDALERSARETKDLEKAREAHGVANRVLQININYQDIRDRFEKLNALIEQLSSGG